MPRYIVAYVVSTLFNSVRNFTHAYIYFDNISCIMLTFHALFQRYRYLYTSRWFIRYNAISEIYPRPFAYYMNYMHIICNCTIIMFYLS